MSTPNSSGRIRYGDSIVLSTTTSASGMYLRTRRVHPARSAILIMGLVGDSSSTSATRAPSPAACALARCCSACSTATRSVVSMLSTSICICFLSNSNSRLEPPYRSSPAITHSPGRTRRMMTSRHAIPHDTAYAYLDPSSFARCVSSTDRDGFETRV